MSPRLSVAKRRARANSRAVEESSPRVELDIFSTIATFTIWEEMNTYLSQHPILALVASASAMLTLFLSPPLTPLIAASPTFVRRTCLNPNTVLSIATSSAVKSLFFIACGFSAVGASSASAVLRPSFPLLRVQILEIVREIADGERFACLPEAAGIFVLAAKCRVSSTVSVGK